MSYYRNKRRLQFPPCIDPQLKQQLIDKAMQEVCPKYPDCRSLRNLVLAAWNDPNAKLKSLRKPHYTCRTHKYFYAIRKHVDEAVSKPQTHSENVSGPPSISGSAPDGERSQHSSGGISSRRKRRSTSEREEPVENSDARFSESLGRSIRREKRYRRQDMPLSHDTLTTIPSSLPVQKRADKSAPEQSDGPSASNVFAWLSAGSLICKGNNEVRKVVHVVERIVKTTSVAEARVMEALQKVGQHKNLLRMLDCRRAGAKMEIAMELMDMRDLGRLVEEVRLGEEELAYISRETLHGLAYMHSKGFVHGDVKPGNVLAHSDGSVKLGDFDHSSKVEDFAYGGTDGYMAPEVVERKQCGTVLDIFSFGRFVAELTRAELQKGRLNTLSRGQAFQECSPLLQNFLTECLKVDQTERPTAEELLKHPFLAKAERGAEKFALSVEELALQRKLAPIQEKLREMEMRKLNLGINEFSFV